MRQLANSRQRHRLSSALQQSSPVPGVCCERLDAGTVTMSMSCRKRAAAFSLEMPSASRLSFDTEHVAGSSNKPTSFRERPAQSQGRNVASVASGDGAAWVLASRSESALSRLKYTPEKKRQKLSTISEVASCDGVVDVRDDFKSGSKTYLKPRSGRPTREIGDPPSCSPPAFTHGGERQQAAAAPWGSGGWLGPNRKYDSTEVSNRSEQSPEKDTEEGQGRALVQLKIDAMFTGTAAQKAIPTCHKTRPDAVQLDDSKATPGEEGMEVDNGTAASDDDVRAEIGPTCYVCRGGLGSEGGDVLCSFCDRAACKACYQSCFACELPHCSLCLAADFSTQFESYFCPPCHQDRTREESGGGAADTVD